MTGDYSHILLYSNFSDNCAQFYKLVTSKIGKNFTSIFNPVCIDSEEVRKKLSNSTTIKVEYVPCIIEIHRSGNMKKYEGKEAFLKLDVLLNEITGETNSITNMNGKKAQAHSIFVNSKGSKLIEEDEDGYEGEGDKSTPIGNLLNKSNQDKYANSVDVIEKFPNVPMRGKSRNGFGNGNGNGINIDSGILPENGLMSLTSNSHIDNEMEIPQSRLYHQPILKGNRKVQEDEDIEDIESMNYQREEERRIQSNRNKKKTVRFGNKQIDSRKILDLDDIDDMEDNNESELDPDSDPSGMNVPREETIPIGGNSTQIKSQGQGIGIPTPSFGTEQMQIAGKKTSEKSIQIKNLAQEMAREREMEEKQVDLIKRGVGQEQRYRAVNGI